MKIPLKRALLSVLVLPGLGQYRNGQKIKGIVFFVFVVIIVTGYLTQIAFLFSDYFASIISLSDPASMVNPKETVKTFHYGLIKSTAFWGIAGLIVWISSGVDAYMVAIRLYGDVEKEEIKAKKS